MSMDEWIIRYIPDDIILAIPSDAEHIAWESFPAILEECPEDEDTVGVYCKGSILLICKRIDGRWQVNMAGKSRMRFQSTPEALYRFNGWGMEWAS